MNFMKKHLSIGLLIALMLNSCAIFKHPKIDVINDHEGYYKTTQKFLEVVKANSYHKAKRMLYKSVIKYPHGRKLVTWGLKDLYGVKFYVKTYSEYLNKYGIPDRSKWKIRYDINEPIVKYVQIKIPIFNGYDSTNHLEHAAIILSFDYSGHYVPSSKIVWFDQEAHLDLK